MNKEKVSRKTGLPEMYHQYASTFSPVDKLDQFIAKYQPYIQIRDFNGKFVIYGFTVALCNILTTILELKVKQNIDRSEAVLQRGKKKKLLDEIVTMLLNLE